MAERLDYYSVLGCDPSSSEEQIITEFRVRAKQTHPDKDGKTEEFQASGQFMNKKMMSDEDRLRSNVIVITQVLQEAKETLLNRAKRTLYDKWRGSGIEMSFKQWESLKETVQASMHWASPKNERMLPEGREDGKEEEKEEETDKENRERAGRSGQLKRQDSCHPTIVMVNKCNQEDLRKKFRNYEI